MLPEVGDQLDRYIVEAVLGQGAAATVYRVRHSVLGSFHALKVLMVSSPGLAARLLREGRVQAALQHPNLVPVTDVVEVHGMPALVARFVDGPTMEAWLAEGEGSVDERLRIFAGLLDGVEAAHAAGVVHRDLKPANILLEKGPAGLRVPRISDFGIARLVDDQSMVRTRANTMMGTPAYMAPEQFTDAAGADGRADLFSLGCILYELMTDRRCFPQSDLMSVARAVQEGDFIRPLVRRPGLPPAVAAAIEGALVPDRGQRFQSCADFRAALAAEAPVWPSGLSPSPARRAPTRETLPLGGTLTPSATEPGSLSAGPLATPAPPAAPLWRRPAGLAMAALGLLLLGQGIYQLWAAPSAELRQDDGPEPVFVDVPAPGEPPAADLDEAVTQQSAPAVGAPASASPRQTGTSPAPAGAQLLVAEAPVAEAPVAAPPAPERRPAPAPARVAVVGDARSVALLRGGQRHPPGALEPGEYKVMADFGDGADTHALTLDLRAGELVTLRCSVDFTFCKKEGS